MLRIAVPVVLRVKVMSEVSTWSKVTVIEVGVEVEDSEVV